MQLAVQIPLWSLEFVIQINIKHDTIAEITYDFTTVIMTVLGDPRWQIGIYASFVKEVLMKF